MSQERPYCQIAKGEISAQHCFQMQGQEGCFGCAALTRKCEGCKARIVDVPAVGLCSYCLTKELKKAVEARKPSLTDGSRKVKCQILKREIGVEMCLAIQGQEGCRNCKVWSRLCEKCKSRPSRFWQYGLCLICTVEEFAEGWQPVDISEEQTKKERRDEKQVQVPEQKRDEHMNPTLRKRTEQKPVPKQEVIKKEIPAPLPWRHLPVLKKPKMVAELCVRCLKRPVAIYKRKLCNSCAVAFYTNRKKRRMRSSVTLTIRQVKEFRENFAKESGVFMILCDVLEKLRKLERVEKILHPT